MRLLVDMDGVLYRGGTPLPGLVRFFEWAAERGHSVALVTNNATSTQADFARKLAGMGVAVDPAAIITSSIATARWLHREAAPGAGVLVVGGPGLFQAVFAPELGFRPEWRSPEWVVAGADFDLTYAKLTAACLALQRGARFVGTNPDTTLPTEDGLAPGAGAIQAVLTLVTGKAPVVIGKPETPLLEMALEGMPPGAGEVVVLGDRLDTDILAGQRIGARTVLLLTGVSTRAEAQHGEVRPDLIVEGLPELMQVLDSR